MQPVSKKYNALFVSKSSVYFRHRFIDCYDYYRNALSCNNGLPAIAHPPCRLWSKMRGLSTADISEKKYALWSLNYIRTYGGVLEHPATSQLWLNHSFNKIGVIDNYGGFLFPVYQGDFGFFTPKPTLLYIIGITPDLMPDYPLSFDLRLKREFSNLTPEQRSHTTDHFFLYLNSIMYRIINN